MLLVVRSVSEILVDFATLFLLLLSAEPL